MKKELNDLREAVQLASVQRDSSVTMNNEQSKAEHNVIVCDDAPELINAQSASESMLKHVKFSDLSVFHTKDQDAAWHTIQKPPEKLKELPRRMIGSSDTSSSTVRAVQRSAKPKLWHIFA